jgi:hypothetical protein
MNEIDSQKLLQLLRCLKDNLLGKLKKFVSKIDLTMFENSKVKRNQRDIKLRRFSNVFCGDQIRCFRFIRSAASVSLCGAKALGVFDWKRISDSEDFLLSVDRAPLCDEDRVSKFSRPELEDFFN